METKIKQSPNGIKDTNGTKVTGDVNPPPPSVESILKAAEMPSDEIKKMLRRDLMGARQLLDAILSDTELQDVMAKWFLGRTQNLANKLMNDPAKMNMFNDKKATA